MAGVGPDVKPVQLAKLLYQQPWRQVGRLGRHVQQRPPLLVIAVPRRASGVKPVLDVWQRRAVRLQLVLL